MPQDTYKLSSRPSLRVRLVRLGLRGWIFFIISLAVLGSVAYVLARQVVPQPSGAIPGVRLYLESVSEQINPGEDVDITVFLDSVEESLSGVGESHDVVAVAVYLTFDSNIFSMTECSGEGDCAGIIDINPLWSSVADISVSGNTIEIAVGEPSPGRRGSAEPVASLTLQVQENVDDEVPLSGFSEIIFDDARSAIIVDDGRGTNILSEVEDGQYYIGSFLQSCGNLGGEICTPSQVCLTSEITDDDFSSTCCVRKGSGETQLACGAPGANLLRITKGPSVDVDVDCDDPASRPPSADVSWTTELDSDGQVAYRIDSCMDCSWDDFIGGADSVWAGSGQSVEHIATLADLGENTTYYYKVRSQATGERVAVSPQRGFSTSCMGAIDETFEISASSVDPKARSVVVSWHTNKLANSRVDLLDGITGEVAVNNKNQSTFRSASPTFSHSLRIPALEPSTRYCIRVTSVTDSGDDSEQAQYPVDSMGMCFTTLFEDLSFNANSVLKVEPDRVCGEWLACGSAIELKDERGQSQPPLCFDRLLCDKIDPSSGSCLSFLDSSKIAQTFTQFGPSFDPDVVASQTIDEIRNLSGHSRVGISLSGFSDPTITTGFYDGVVEGYYPYGAFSQVGNSIYIPNGDFETRERFPWKPWPDHADKKLLANFENKSDRSDRRSDLNRILEVTPKLGDKVSGITVPLGRSLRATTEDREFNYYVSMDVKVDSSSLDSLVVQFGFNNNSSYPNYASQNIPTTTYWRRVTAGPFRAEAKDLGGQTYLNILVDTESISLDTASRTRDFGTFSIDNVSIEPILEVAPNKFVGPSCRLYPSDDAPSCNYVDLNSGRRQQGWGGYCVEVDPADPSRCIQWQPIDLIAGSNLTLASYAPAGYQGRTPLYYCAQARGNAPYERLATTFKDLDPIPLAPEVFIDNLKGGFYDISGLGDFTFIRDVNGNDLTEFYDYEIEQISISLIKGKSTKNGVNEWGGGEVFSLNSDNKFEVAWCGSAGSNTCSYDSGTYTNPESRFYWKKVVTSISLCSGDDLSGNNLWGAKARFDNKGKLEGIEAGLCDGTNGNGWLQADIKFYLREWCTQVAQVVDPFGRNTAWAKRIASESSEVPGVGYDFSQDSEPFGSIVPPAPDFDPSLWDGSPEKYGNRLHQPLYVEPANKRLFPIEPHQVRAGSPYSVFKKELEEGICLGGPREDKSCTYDSQCKGRNDGGRSGGRTIPGGVCSVRNNIYQVGSGKCVSGRKVGTECSAHSDCGFSPDGSMGRCTGVEIPASALNERTFLDKLQSSNGGSFLSQLFARSQQMWEWDSVSGKYTSGNVDKKFLGCNKPGQCDNGVGWDVTGQLGASGEPEYATLPVVGNIRLKANDITYSDDSAESSIARFTDGVGTVSVLFNSEVSANQLPLVRYTVDWGDGAVSEESGLRIAAQTESDHAFSHTYIKPGAYTPRVQIEDNWGWCSGDVISSGGQVTNGVHNYTGNGFSCDSWDYAPVQVEISDGDIVPTDDNQPPVADAIVYEELSSKSQNLKELVVFTEDPRDTFVQVTLDGEDGATGSYDPDGDQISYIWTDSYNGQNSTIGYGPKAYPKLETGIHDITLTVSDGRGGEDTDIVTVQVNRGGDVLVSVGNVSMQTSSAVYVPIVYSVLGVNDPLDLNPITSYSFTLSYSTGPLISAGVSVTGTATEAWGLPTVNDNRAAGIVTVSGEGQPISGDFGVLVNLGFKSFGTTGTFPFNFIRADLNGLSRPTVSYKRGSILVGGGNNELTAVITVNGDNEVVVTAQSGESVVFDGSKSTNPTGSAMSYEWNFGDDTNNISGVTQTYTFAEDGVYNVSLNVTDEDDQVATDNVEVHVGDVFVSRFGETRVAGASIFRPSKVEQAKPYEIWRPFVEVFSLISRIIHR